MDTVDTDGGGGEGAPWDRYEMVVISMNGRFFLWRGEEHIVPMLSGDEAAPWPLCCVVIDSPLNLHKVVPEDDDLGEKFMINPMAMHNMREANRVVDLHP